MTLENQVCSLEQAKKLKELGVKQESLFWWWSYLTGHTPKVVYNGKLKPSITLSNLQSFSAFTVSELAEKLPNNIQNITIPDEVYEKTFSLKEVDDDYRLVYNPKFVADTLIYLLENKLISL